VPKGRSCLRCCAALAAGRGVRVLGEAAREPAGHGRAQRRPVPAGRGDAGSAQ